MSRSTPGQAKDLPHPIIARLWNRVSHGCEEKGAAEHRDELLSGLNGRVIEIGAGNGLNFGHYPSTVTEVVAVEPEPYLRGLAEDAAKDAPVSVRVLPGTAEALPADDGEFDAAVFSLVLCTIDDPATALTEARRVLRPGGELRFYEHVRSPRRWFGRAQRVFDVGYSRVNGWGCHAARDTGATIEDAGFEIQRMRRFKFMPSRFEAMVSPHILGIARQQDTQSDA